MAAEVEVGRGEREREEKRKADESPSPVEAGVIIRVSRVDGDSGEEGSESD